MTPQQIEEMNQLVKTYKDKYDQNKNPDVFSPWSYEAGYKAALEKLNNPNYEFLKSLPKPESKEPENFLDVISNWRMFWMFQVQNSEQDFKNYRERAMSVDANMKHHLAELCEEYADKKAKVLEDALDWYAQTGDGAYSQAHLYLRAKAALKQYRGEG